ncbi:MAG TPA: non-ribosomal peptide synthetase, partial [Pseudonocardiaceae bacterium]|nr:non-ribosomal peptide synthetase [Pseudonocardiaceae bacterium]
MATPDVAGRRFWRDVLAAGGGTSVPRWTPDPVPGAARYTAWLPRDLAASVRLLAADLGVPESAVLLAAHAKVLAALSGDQEIVTGYATARRTLPCRLTTEPATWRALIAA